MRSPRASSPGTGTTLGLSIAVEVSALGSDAVAEREFVAFALDALSAEAAASTTTWSVRRLTGSARDAADQPSRRGWITTGASTLGLRPSTRIAAPRADLIFLASGPVPCRLDGPGVVTIHSVEAIRVAERGRERGGLVAELRRSTDRGALVHVTSGTVADAAISWLKLDRSTVMVAHPGVRAVPDVECTDAIGVVAGADPSLDEATLAAIRRQGVRAELVRAGTSYVARPCAVFASHDDTFPFDALRCMGAATPVVTCRSSVTAEILEGAAELVGASGPTEIAEAAVALATSGPRRNVVVAAGRTRAADFEFERRGPELVAVLRRALERGEPHKLR